jgi:hypothetical protein
MDHHPPTDDANETAAQLHTECDPADDAAEGINLFVANLSGDVTDEMLEAAFRPFGPTLSSKVMLDIHTGASRGFGFVLFRNREHGTAAMGALHGTTIGARQIFISIAKTSGRSGLQQTPKLYVRNVPKALTLDILRDHFSTFGPLVKISFREDGTQVAAPSAHRAYLATTQVLFLEYESAHQAEEAVRATHNSRPWPHLQMVVPLLAKPAETSEMRNERRLRQQTRIPATSTLPQCSQGFQTQPSSQTPPFAQPPSIAPPSSHMPVAMTTAALAPPQPHPATMAHAPPSYPLTHSHAVHDASLSSVPPYVYYSVPPQFAPPPPTPSPPAPSALANYGAPMPLPMPRADPSYTLLPPSYGGPVPYSHHSDVNMAFASTATPAHYVPHHHHHHVFRFQHGSAYPGAPFMPPMGHHHHPLLPYGQ